MHYTVSKWFVGGPLEWRLRRRQYNTTDWAIGKKNKKVWERNEALYTRGVCEYPSCPRGNIPLSVHPQHRWIVLRLCSHQREQTHKCLNHTVALWGSCCSYCICPQCVIFHCHGRHRKRSFVYVLSFLWDTGTSIFTVKWFDHDVLCVWCHFLCVEVQLQHYQRYSVNVWDHIKKAGILNLI